MADTDNRGTRPRAWDTPVTRTLGCDLPIVLAPMGGVSGGRLAAAVTQAGGLGLIGPGYKDARWVHEAFDDAGNARVGIGFITWHMARQPEVLDTALARGAAAVMLSFGDPTPFIPKIQATGAKVIAQVQTLADARHAAEAGADLIVAQGGEAGGHGASRGTFALVPAVAEAVAPVPVLAAGGVVDGRSLAAAFLLGAGGALVGTRLYATPEAQGHAAAKRRLLEAGGDDTVRTRVFDVVRGLDWPGGYTGRAARNAFTERWHGKEAALAEAAETERARYQEADAKGDADTVVVWASEGVDRITTLEPAGRIVQCMADEAARLFEQAPASAPQ